MVSFFLIVGSFILNSILHHDQAYGCLCGSHPQDIYYSADIVIKARVDKMYGDTFRTYTNLTVFEIYKDDLHAVSKGVINAEESGPEPCIYPLSTNKLYILAGNVHNGTMTISFCSWLFQNPTQRQVDGLRYFYWENADCAGRCSFFHSTFSRYCLIAEGICSKQEDGRCAWNVNSDGCVNRAPAPIPIIEDSTDKHTF